MPKNKMRQLWQDGGAALGGWCTLSGPHLAEVMGSCGFDYVCVDTQHGLIGYESMAVMIQILNAAPTTCIVRVPSNEDGVIGRTLDAGAEGVIVPMVNTPEEAAAAVAACRFAPEGVRSFGLMRPGLTLGYSPPDINKEVLCLVMVETQEALDNVEAIASTPGVDGIYIGPSDLALSMGVRMWDSPEHTAAVEKIRVACEKAGVIPAIHAGSGDRAKALIETGFRMATIAADGGLVRAGAAAQIRAARGSGGPSGGATTPDV